MNVHYVLMDARRSKRKWIPLTAADVRNGIPATRIDDLVALGFERNCILRVVGAHSTVLRRTRNKGKLTRAESDRLARLGRVVTHAIQVFGSQEKAVHWLLRPISARAGADAPLDMLDTDPGTEWVEDRLKQVAYGMCA